MAYSLYHENGKIGKKLTNQRLKNLINLIKKDANFLEIKFLRFREKLKIRICLMKLLKKIFSIGKLFSGFKKTAQPVRKSANAKNSRKQGAPKRANSQSKEGFERRTGKGQRRGDSRKNDSRNPNRRHGVRDRSRSYEESESSQAEPIKLEPKIVPAPYDMQVIADSIPEFAKFELGAEVLSAVKDMGYSSPTPIQSGAIPVILESCDIIGTAQTGTGKTAAFALPVIKLAAGHKDVGPRVLVLSPTRELAAQSAEAFENFSKYTQLRTLLVQGGTSMDRQIRALKSGMDVVVATPGRLLDHIRQRNLSLKNVKWLVLDEVDRMFDMGFIEDVSNIIRYCPKNRQTLFFSATMPDAVLKLSKWALTDPKTVGIGVEHSPADTIEHFIYPVDGIQKYDMLIEILKQISFESLIVFTRTRIDADRIGEWLTAHDFAVSTLHSDRSQREREKALKDFKEGTTKILVATDIASRGLDISNVGYVINYNVPEHSEDYVHRIGRTGRANREGKAITLYSSDETEFLKRIEAFINTKIERRKLDGFAYRTEPVLTEEAPKKHKRNR